MRIRTCAAAVGAWLAAGVLAASASAQAATVIQTQGFDVSNLIVAHPAATRAWTQRSDDLITVSFEAFDTVLGTLTGVSLAVTGVQDFTYGASIVAPDGADSAMTSTIGGYFSDVVIGGDGLESYTAPTFGLQHCTPVDGVCVVQTSLHRDEAIDVALADLAPFQAGGPVGLDLPSTVTLASIVTVSGDPPPVITLLSSLHWSGQASLTYAYDPAVAVAAGVPEPAAWALMLAGLGLAGAALRRRAPAAA